MKKLIIGMMAAVVVLSAVAIPALARTQTVSKEVGPYEGIFEGYVYGSEGSRAPLKLILHHRDGIVYGWARLGEGLFVSGGRCGGMSLPGTAQFVRGESLSNDVRTIVVETQFEVRGFEIDVKLDSVMSRDGRTLEAQTVIDIPWICGRDPVLEATLERVDPE